MTSKRLLTPQSAEPPKPPPPGHSLPPRTPPKAAGQTEAY